MISLSHWLNQQTPCYGGKKNNLQITVSSDIANGATSNSLHLSMSNHVGTHMDFPKHFDGHGKSLSDYSPDDLLFVAPQILNIPLSPEQMVSVADLDGKIHDKTDFVLLRSGFEERRGEDIYWNNNPGFLPEVGFWLRDNFENVRGIGFDFISLTCFQKRELGREAHRAFLSPYKNHAPILIVEDMKLSPITRPLKRLILAPLPVENADGIPIQALAEI